MATLTVTSTIADGNKDGSQNWTQRNTANPTALFTASNTTAYSIHGSTDNVRTNFFIFRFGNGTSGSGIPQGSTVSSTKLNFRANNGNTSYNDYIYLCVENNLDPLGTGAIVAATAGTLPWRRLGRQSNATALFGARCGPTHNGNLSTTGVSVTSTSAYVYKAFADARAINATSFNLTDNFGPALQALVNDPSWNGDSQYVMVHMFSNPNATAGTDGVGRLDGITWASGQTATSGYPGNSTGQLSSYDTNSAYAAQLLVDLTVPAQDVSITTTAPQLDLSDGETTRATTWTVTSDVNYHDGIGSSNSRLMDIYTPTGTAPSGGWSVALHIHGGGFNAGTKEDVADTPRFIADTLDAGYVMVSIKYKLTIGNILSNSNTGYTNPSAVQDIMCAMKFLATNKTTYNLNTNKMIGTGYSAGGHVLLQSALLAEDSAPDSYLNVYRGTSAALGTRYPNYPALAFTEGRTGIPTIKGVFSLAGPVNLKKVYDLNVFIRSVLVLYFGQLPNNGYPAVSGEGNIDDFMVGLAGTIWSTRSPKAPTFPIGWTWATGDTTVPPDSGYNALYTALTTVGYDVSQSTDGVVARGVALSQDNYADTQHNGGGHDGMMSTYSSTFYRGWLTEVTNQMQTDTHHFFFEL